MKLYLRRTLVLFVHYAAKPIHFLAPSNKLSCNLLAPLLERGVGVTFTTKSVHSSNETFMDQYQSG